MTLAQGVPLVLIWTTYSGLSFLWIGGFGLTRRWRGSGWWFFAFLLGGVLWGYSVNGWINWKFPIIHTISPLHTTNCTPMKDEEK